MAKSKAAQAEEAWERAEAVAQLQEWIQPGATVQLVLRRVSRSGMSRTIAPFLAMVDRHGGVVVLHIGGYVSKATGIRWDTRNRDGLRVDGGNMDMGAYLVMCLSRALFRDGGLLRHRWL